MVGRWLGVGRTAVHRDLCDDEIAYRVVLLCPSSLVVVGRFPIGCRAGVIRRQRWLGQARARARVRAHNMEMCSTLVTCLWWMAWNFQAWGKQRACGWPPGADG